MNKLRYMLAAELAAFVVLMILLKTVDVAPIGPDGTAVGLSHINAAFHNLTGVNMELYNVTEYLGYAAIMVAGYWALCGLIQLISRRSLKKVDREIWILGDVFVALAIVYVAYELFVVNYRPVIMPGDLEVEASFPSSHTILGCVVLLATAMIIDKYVASKAFASLTKFICVILCAVLVIGRLLSGVHWLTDIIGGIIISGALLTAMRIVLLKKPIDNHIKGLGKR